MPSIVRVLLALTDTDMPSALMSSVDLCETLPCVSTLKSLSLLTVITSFAWICTF